MSSSIKQAIRKEKGMTMTSIKKNHPAAPKQVVSVFDLGYLGVGKDFPEQISSIPNRKKKAKKSCLQKKKSTTRITPEKG